MNEWAFMNKKFQKDISFQAIFLFILPAIAIIGLALYVHVSQQENLLVEASAHEMALINAGKTGMEGSLEGVKNDVEFLSHYHELRKYIDHHQHDAKIDILNDFALLMKHRNSYDQIRWIDETGMEKFRIDYRNGDTLIKQDGELQNKKGRYYFQNSAGLPIGSIYVSPFDLNVEHGKVEIPYKPMIRIATPLVDIHGHRRGILIINYLGSYLIEKFQNSTAASYGTSMILDEQGYFLKGEKAADEWGFMRHRSDLTLGHRYPSSWNKIASEDHGQFEDAQGLWTFKTVYLQTKTSSKLVKRDEDFGWKVVTFVPADVLYEKLNKHLPMIFIAAVIGLFLAGIGSFGLAYLYRKKEKALSDFKELQKKTEGILLSIPDIIMQVDNDKRYVWANTQGLTFFGADVIGHEAAEYFEGEQDTYETVHPLLEGSIDSVYVESWQRRHDGQKRLLAWWCQNLRDEEGNITGALSTARDITQEYEREKVLTMQSHLLEAAKDSIIMHDLQGNFLYLNENAWKTRGYTHEEMLKMSVRDLDAPEFTVDYEKRMAEVVDQMRTNGSIRIEVEHLCKNGERIPVEVNAKLIEIDKKSYVLSSVRDISERKASQQILEKSEKKYRDMVEHATIGIYRCDVSGNILYVNPALVKMLCYDSPDELIGTSSVMRYKNPEDREILMERLLREDHLENYELELLDKYGVAIPVMVSATVDDTVLSGMIIDMREIKQSRYMIDKLFKAVEQIDDIVYMTDKFGTISYVNNAYCTHTGYDREEVIGQNSRISKSGVHNREFYKELWTTILDGKVYRNTLVNRKKNGDLYYEKKTITPLKDEDHVIIGFVSTGKDVTEETMLHQEIERIATIDQLTGIYNRHKFEELFALESERSRRFLQPLSLILIDIDHFKSVNDTHGHDVGDKVLVQLAATVQENIRKIDVFARWGGEEFLVLCPSTDRENVREFAEKLRVAVENTLFPVVGKITISLGVSLFDPQDSFSELFKRADQGLYYAKEHGRNQVGMF